MRRVGWATLVLALGAAAPAAAAPVDVRVLSSRADLVSGGDALVRVTLEQPADLAALRVSVGTREVTSAFAKRANGQVEGLVTGIPDGPSTLIASVPGRHGARLQLDGHPNGGPLISGPQLKPWYCQAGAVDAQCNQPASYAFKAGTPGGFVDYDPASPPPTVAQTTTTDGRTVPFIVRVETGYQDRDQYTIATLYDPAKPWAPWEPQAGWNRRLVIAHGGSCGTDRAAGAAPDVMDADLLGKGFMVGSTALNNLGHNCNPVVIAESELMLRERASEVYGPPQATIGKGCSGGSIAQTMLAHAYPGFYDGITVQCTFADLFTTGKQAVHGHLFKTFFNAPPPGSQVYTPEDQAAVNGSPLATGDDNAFDAAFWAAIDGSGGCGGIKETDVRWTPSTPNGIRCGVLDYNVNVLGKGPSGYGAVPFDNVGLQYGLKALLAGQLTPAKFADFNANVGGLDKTTYAHTAARTEADVPAVVNAYRAGYMAIGNTLPDTPILEGRGSNESSAHVTYPTKVLDARLMRFAGTTRSHALWQGPVPLLGGADFADRMVVAMDRWVAAVQGDGREVPKAVKVREKRPADIVDHCEFAGGATQDGTDCPALVRYYDPPTVVAGESLRDDVLKCQLKPLAKGDYPGITFTDAEWGQLQQAFPTGVCDWTKAGVGETETVPWLTFADGPGGRPLGEAPRSTQFSLARPVKTTALRAGLKAHRLARHRFRLTATVRGLAGMKVRVALLRGTRRVASRSVTVLPSGAARVRFTVRRAGRYRVRVTAGTARVTSKRVRAR